MAEKASDSLSGKHYGCRNLACWALHRCKWALLGLFRWTYLLALISLIMAVTLIMHGRHLQPSIFTWRSGQDNTLNPPAYNNSNLRFHETEHAVDTTRIGVKEFQPHPTTSSPEKRIILFAQKYTGYYAGNDTEFLIEMAAIQQQKWTRSLKAKEFRDDLRAALGNRGSLENFILTKQNTRPGKLIKFYRRGRFMKISKEFWKSLPDVTFYRPGLFSNCSIVGSSGILNGSRCGNHIDKAEYVFRFNLADVKGYEEDVGSKTNFTTLNPSLLVDKYKSLKNQNSCSAFEVTLKQFNGSHLWLPVFSLSSTHQVVVKAAKTAEEYKTVTPIYGHPDHFTTLEGFWKRTLNVTSWMTSGLHVITSMFDVCDQIDVYGFWPFPKSLNGEDVPYHYHNNKKVKKVHSFSKEFKALFHFHRLGLINMHIGSCYRST